MFIIVLGNPPNKDGSIPYNLKTRLDLAIEIYKNNIGSKLVMTGGTAYSNLVEAIVMKEYCVKKGILESDILVETNAKSTYDNALYVAEMLTDNGSKEITIITSRYHKKRVDLIFRHYFKKYVIFVPKLTIIYVIKNLHIYIWEIYLIIKLILKGDNRLERKAM